MTVGLHLHLFYSDVALELIGRVAVLGPVEVIVTHAGPLDAAVAAALERLPGAVERIETPNLGWDIAPLLHILPRVRERGWKAIGHLHTKKGDSGYAPEWRAIAYEAMIANSDLMARIATAFAEDPALMLAGSAALYKSAASHQFRNAALLSELAPCLLAPAYPPADWGFFAGSFFWARVELLERVAVLANFSGGDAERDGTLAHALERLIGLAPVATGGAIGLINEEGALDVVHAPGRPSHEPIIRTLVDRAERFVAPLDAELASLIAQRNPLVDYVRHGRDEGALDPNPYFSSGWYNRIHADVFAAGMHPLHHYMHHGWPEGRATGPLFDGLHYRAAYEDVAGDPLRHFLAVGAREGRVAIPISRPEYETSDERPRRFYRHFDIVAEEAFLRAMAALPKSTAEAAADMLVSVVMPVWNRAETVGAAIRSVLAQTHAKLELIVIDDGSTDGTVAAVRAIQDRRIRLIEADHAGVSVARNRGLEAAKGELIAYLDSDNRWTGWFLEVMTRFLGREGLDAAYCGIALRDDLGQLTGYRGDDFDWEACLTQNYVDLNAFVHRRGLTDTVGGFDPNLRRMVDWDLILRIGKDRPIGYAPFVGCDYFDGKADTGRVTTAEPAAFQKLVWTKNRFALATGTSAFAAKVTLSFAIKCAAPEEEKAAWGDYHFAESLAEAIRRLGHTAHVDLRGNWTGRAVSDEDVVIVLRGLLPYEPRPGQMAFLWNISHPDQVPLAEVDRYSRVYVASESHAALLRHLTHVPVAALLQATDQARFHPVAKALDGPELLFVGNSRGIDRPIVEWAIKAGRSPVVYGGGWEGRLPRKLLAGEIVDNRALGLLYVAAGAVLNDHWPSMAAFGYLSNRLFDVVAAGGRAISDPVPSMAVTFGDAVAQVDGPAALARALDAAWTPGDMPVRVAEAHSFDARARTLVADAFALLGLDAPMPSRPAVPRSSLRVHVMASFGPYGPQSSAFIRWIAPLTDDSVAGRVEVTLGAADDTLPECDICVVQRTALPNEGAVDRLVGALAERGAALVTDVDDAFIALGEHPEAARYRPLARALERAVAASAETWFSTDELARLYGRIAGRRHVQPNGLDPRLWRDWRNPRALAFAGDKVRMLYMGTHTHGEDFACIRPALDQLWEEREDAFDVTLIGVAPDVAAAPWLRRLSPPGEAIAYPRFTRWLREQGPFDIGLAPLAETEFNRAKSDIKLLDYAALGLLPVVEDAPAYRADPGLAEFVRWGGDWFATLLAVLDDRGDARDRAEALHAHVWTHRTVRQAAPAMVTQLEELMR